MHDGNSAHKGYTYILFVVRWVGRVGVRLGRRRRRGRTRGRNGERRRERRKRELRVRRSPSTGASPNRWSAGRESAVMAKPFERDSRRELERMGRERERERSGEGDSRRELRREMRLGVRSPTCRGASGGVGRELRNVSSHALSWRAGRREIGWSAIWGSQIWRGS
ncbi:uncharacterized protein A4U43_C09F5400 [Asparagus officinalis]|uniref:Uncharacterized protein n=1 Tax=Asparagus officinalis TaxID=4686 RepID=A0A5P1E612_ASPOF|nr:uncharacterized protein A4U43_C09F5400 [Asparagus officinalis]